MSSDLQKKLIYLLLESIYNILFVCQILINICKFLVLFVHITSFPSSKLVFLIYLWICFFPPFKKHFFLSNFSTFTQIIAFWFIFNGYLYRTHIIYFIFLGLLVNALILIKNFFISFWLKASFFHTKKISNELKQNIY